MDWQNILKEGGYLLMTYVLMGWSSTEEVLTLKRPMIASGTIESSALIQ